MPTRPAEGDKDKNAEQRSEVDEIKCGQAVKRAQQHDGQKYTLPQDQSRLVGPSDPRDQKPCPVCFGFDFPAPLWRKEHREAPEDSPFNSGGALQYPRCTEIGIETMIDLERLKCTSEAGCPSCQLLREIWERLPRDGRVLGGIIDKPTCIEIFACRNRAYLLKHIQVVIPGTRRSLSSDICFHRVPGNYLITPGPPSTPPRGRKGIHLKLESVHLLTSGTRRRSHECPFQEILDSHMDCVTADPELCQRIR